MKLGTKLGLAVGLIAFLLVGVMPGAYFGGLITITLLSNLLSTSLHPTVLNRIAVALGMSIGVFCAGSTLVVIGSVLGTLLEAVVIALSQVKLFKTEAKIIQN